MDEIPGVRSAEIPKPEINIRNNNGQILVDSPRVSLASEKDPLRFILSLQKVPTVVNESTKIENITLDRKGEKLQRMFQQAAELKGIPERERPRKIMELLRSSVSYAYNAVLDEVARSNPELAAWVAQNTGLNSNSSSPLTLSEIVDNGYGICRHLSAAMLALANEAGMEAAYCSHSTSPTSPIDEKYMMRNVIRRDTGEALFKLTPPGNLIYGAHAWVELKTSDGDWIPVDPSTQLVGDTPEGMETFKEANYLSMVQKSLEVDNFPPGGATHLSFFDLAFRPGEDTHMGILEVNTRPKRKPFVFKGTPAEPSAQEEQWPKPTSYDGPLHFQIHSTPATSGITVIPLEAKVA